MRKGRRVLVASFVAMLVLSLAQLSSAAAHDHGITRPAGTADAVDTPAPEPGLAREQREGSSTCTAPVAGKFTCLTVTEVQPDLAAPTGDVSARAANIIPNDGAD